MSGYPLTQIQIRDLAERVVRGELDAVDYFAIVDRNAEALVLRFVDLTPGWSRRPRDH